MQTKQQFLADVKYFAQSLEGFKKQHLQNRGRFAQDKELTAIWNKIQDDYELLAVTCKRKLEEAGIK